MAAGHSVDVLCVSESWLRKEQPSATVRIPGFELPLRELLAEVEVSLSMFVMVYSQIISTAPRLLSFSVLVSTFAQVVHQ